MNIQHGLCAHQSFFSLTLPLKTPSVAPFWYTPEMSSVRAQRIKSRLSLCKIALTAFIMYSRFTGTQFLLLISEDTCQRLRNMKKLMMMFSSCRHFPISIQYCHHHQQDPFQLASKEKKRKKKNWFAVSHNLRIFARYFFFYWHGSRSQ